jgi:NADPH2:quinone reductase
VKAVRIHEDGGPEVLRYEDVEDPAPGPGEVLVRLRAASLNHLDLWIRQGLPSVPKPRILGADGAGVVAALGEGADTFSEGDRVVLNPGLDDGARILGEHMDGTHAQLVAVPAEYVHPIPGGLSFEEAAAFPLVFETAYRMLVTKARIEEDEWVLLWGIGSGVALAAFAIAKALGARTLVTSSSAEKLDRAIDLGADVAIDYREPGWPGRVRDAVGEVDVVFDGVGGAVARSAFGLLGRGGRMVSFGMASGEWANVSDEAAGRGVELIGPSRPAPEEARASTEHALTEAAAGRLRPVIGQRFPLGRAADAHAAIESRATVGKTLLEVRVANGSGISASIVDNREEMGSEAASRGGERRWD